MSFRPVKRLQRRTVTLLYPVKQDEARCKKDGRLVDSFKTKHDENEGRYNLSLVIKVDYDDKVRMLLNLPCFTFDLLITHYKEFCPIFELPLFELPLSHL